MNQPEYWRLEDCRKTVHWGLDISTVSGIIGRGGPWVDAAIKRMDLGAMVCTYIASTPPKFAEKTRGQDAVEFGS
jgi:hypothetical protein